MGAMNPKKVRAIKKRDGNEPVDLYAKGGSTKGLWANIHAKRKRIAAGSGERMRAPGAKGAPTAKALRESKNSKG
jgi:hypothetical protein